MSPDPSYMRFYKGSLKGPVKVLYGVSSLGVDRGLSENRHDLFRSR